MNDILGQKVEVGEIDRELKKLWESDEAATNASLMNLAIYSEQAGDLARNSEAIQELTREHACRAILIGMEREAPEPSIESWITAHCHLAHGRKTVCCEQLSFLLKGKAVGRLRNTVFAHLNSDLPLVFWWQGELSDLFEERLYRLMERLVVDSAEWSEVSGGFARLASAVQDSRCQMAVQDLAWTRTYHFRLGIAGLFDDPVAEKMLGSVESVKVVGRAENWTSAWMMIAWLATQAKWQLSSMSEESFVFRRKDGGEVQVTVENDPEGAALGLVEMSDGEATVSVTRAAGSAFLNLALSSPNHEVSQMTPADPDGRVDLVAEQLSRGGKNSLFRKIWPTLFAMLGMTTPQECES